MGKNNHNKKKKKFQRIFFLESLGIHFKIPHPAKKIQFSLNL